MRCLEIKGFERVDHQLGLHIAKVFIKEVLVDFVLIADLSDRGLLELDAFADLVKQSLRDITTLDVGHSERAGRGQVAQSEVTLGPQRCL